VLCVQGGDWLPARCAAELASPATDHKVSPSGCKSPNPAEYGLLWATFGAIMQWGLEAGIAAGIVLATLYFAWGYAQVRGTSRHHLALDAVLCF
jgi:MFS superfamily sulfate permease-like transporter